MIRFALFVVVALAASGCKNSEESGRNAAAAEDKLPPGERAPRSIQEDFVGTDPARFVFEKTPLIGAKLDTLKASYGAAVERVGELGATLKYPGAMGFPGAPEKGRDLHVDVYATDGVIYSYEIGLRIEHQDALVAAMTKTRGAPTGSLDAGGLVWGDKPKTLLERKSGTGTTDWLKITVQ